MLIFFSIAAFRRHYYETFMALHIVFAALFLYTCWEHVTNFSGIEWIYAAIAIWGVDRIVRITRIALLGFPKADLQLVGSDLVRVTVKKPKKFWKAKTRPIRFRFLLASIVLLAVASIYSDGFLRKR